jgi:hypothetical protein
MVVTDISVLPGLFLWRQFIGVLSIARKESMDLRQKAHSRGVDLNAQGAVVRLADEIHSAS